MEEADVASQENGDDYVYEDSCFICHQKCYSKPTSPSTAPNRPMTKWASETRESVYEAFGIQVDPSFFQETQEELPICSSCSFTVGRMKVVQNQLQDRQALYDKIRDEIAISIVDVVASTGGSRTHLVNLGNRSLTSRLKSFQQSEAECLQQLIFESWHDRTAAADDDDKKAKDTKGTKVRTTNDVSNLPKLEHISTKIQNDKDDQELQYDNNVPSPAPASMPVSTRKSQKQKKGPKFYKCPVSDCDYTAPLKTELTSHMGTHTGKNLYKCQNPGCDYSATRNYVLQEHQVVHTKEKKFSCPTCHHKFGLKSNLNKHVRIHENLKPFFCPLCPFRTNRRGSIKTHMTHAHTTERNFKCHICLYAGKTKPHLKAHLKTHSQDKPFVCDQCPYKSQFSKSLKRHMKTHNKKIRKKPFSCSLCDYQGSSAQQLSGHVVQHTGDMPFKCHLCSYATAHSSARLRRHLKIHEKETEKTSDGDKEKKGSS